MADSTATVVNPTQTNRPHQNRRRGRGRNQNVQQQPSINVQAVNTNRRFGGQLTRTSNLQADAPAFVPASVAPIPTKKSSSKPPSETSSVSGNSKSTRGRRSSRSTAPDLATRIQEDIAKNLYECAICSSEVTRRSKVWSCTTCWTVFHIGCIKKWSKNEGSAVARTAQDENSEPYGKQWRCPGCNLPKDVFPSVYTCWCEKEIDPKVPPGLPPHSCGQTCGRDRKFPKPCPHPCDQLCHAGPCPPCTSMGSVQSCFCGKSTSTRRCLETEYEAGWSCGQICGDLMPCGEHICERPCHEGLCGGCIVEVDARCYCGKVQKTLPCREKGEEKKSFDWIGIFDCGEKCGRIMDCGIHSCQKDCHPQDAESPRCPRSPDLVSYCPCGKVKLSELQPEPRKSCSDPIPNCNKSCEKKLSCGHPCSEICHLSECPPCQLIVPIPCRCGRNTFKVNCFGGSKEQPCCTRVCRARLNCGRHECGETCCPGERQATERLKRKQKTVLKIDSQILSDDVEAEHICTEVCGRMLKCGNHPCTELCHKGPCGSCKEAIFEDISCNCGRTILQAPLPCGTRPPHCNFPCQRPKQCGHPQVTHNCHNDDEECPRCAFLTEKQCLCGKKALKNQPCWRTDALCGLVCGKTLKCGSHKCRKTCHKEGECEDAHLHCQQECSKPKKTCGHPCELPCHAPSACKESSPCPFKIIITCDCQRRKEEVKCNARAGVQDPPGRHNSLKCDDECARLERNRRLAAALNIPDEHTDDHIPYSTTTLNIYLEDVAWAHQQEDILRIFAADEKEKRIRFKPMKPRQRAFIHSLAEDFGFDGESLDPEPHRHVHLFKTPKFVAAPMKTLAQAARIKRAQMNTQIPVESHTAGQERPEKVTKPMYNGLLLRNPRFALTEDELRDVIKNNVTSMDFNITFFSKSDSVALIPREQGHGEEMQALLTSLQPNMSATLIGHELVASVTLCEIGTQRHNSEPIILHEAGAFGSTRGNAGGAWSQVAGKRVAPIAAPTVQPVGQRSTFTVLNSKVAEAKKRRQEEAAWEKERMALQREPVVEDWSLEVEKEENVVNSDEVENIPAVAEFASSHSDAPNMNASS